MEIYVPDCYQESIFKINYEMLKEKNIKCLLFDIDNTILPYNKIEVTDELKEHFDKLNKEFKVILFSNALKKRVTTLGKLLNVDYVYCACKPSSKKFLELLKKYKLLENEVAIIGDQLVTDIKGGNNVGIFTILINPISKCDSIFTKLGRLRETKIKKKLRHNNLFKGRFYDEKV